jgi:hypothetical protein
VASVPEDGFERCVVEVNNGGEELTTAAMIGCIELREKKSPQDCAAVCDRPIRPVATCTRSPMISAFLKVTAGRIPTRKELARTALRIIFRSAALVVLWTEFFTR